MLMTLSYKFRLLPSDEQKAALDMNLAAARFVYNHFLAMRRNSKNSFVSMYFLDTARALTKLKQEDKYLWLKKADSSALQQSLRALEAAYSLFFSKKVHPPAFKQKNAPTQSYKTTGQNIKLDGNFVRLPKVGFVRFIRSRDFDGKIKHAVISKTLDGKYYISFCVESDFTPMAKTGKAIGVSLGLDNFYTDSNAGNGSEYLLEMARLEAKLSRAKQALARKVKHSKNYDKQLVKLYRLRTKMANIRKDYLNKLSTNLIRDNDVIAVSALDVKSLYAKRSLDKNSYLGYSELYRNLRYKAKKLGKDVLFYPGTQDIKISSQEKAKELLAACDCDKN